MRKKTKKHSTIKSKTGSTLNSEQSYLIELISDFPCPKKIQLPRAEKLLLSRYRQLEKNIPNFLELLDNPTFKHKFQNQLSVPSSVADILPFQLYAFTFIFHMVLFDKIINNSGQIRKSTDPNGGRIGFGGDDSRIIGKFKYEGSPCTLITSHLTECFALLTKNPKDPISSSIEFYRRFVKIHPFYDANGRIGRLILSIYNRYHGFYIKWGDIDKGGNKSKFLRKLNGCHRREGQSVYSTHFQYLVSFFRKFVIPVSELTKE